MSKAKHLVHGELKNAQLTAKLTPTTKALLREKANKMGVSIGEMLEMFARGKLPQVERMGEE